MEGSPLTKTVVDSFAFVVMLKVVGIEEPLNSEAASEKLGSEGVGRLWLLVAGWNYEVACVGKLVSTLLYGMCCNFHNGQFRHNSEKEKIDRQCAHFKSNSAATSAL